MDKKEKEFILDKDYYKYDHIFSETNKIINNNIIINCISNNKNLESFFLTKIKFHPTNYINDTHKFLKLIINSHKYKERVRKEFLKTSNTNFTLKITSINNNYGIFFNTDFNKYGKFCFYFPSYYNASSNYCLDVSIINDLKQKLTPEYIIKYIYIFVFERLPFHLNRTYKKIINYEINKNKDVDNKIKQLQQTNEEEKEKITEYYRINNKINNIDYFINYQYYINKFLMVCLLFMFLYTIFK